MAVSTGRTFTLGSPPPISAWQTPCVLGPRMKSKMSLHSGVMTRSKRTRGCWLSGSVELRSGSAHQPWCLGAAERAAG